MQSKIQFRYDTNFSESIVNGIPVKIQQNGNQVVIFGDDTDGIVRCLVKNSVPFYDLKILPPTLESAYLSSQAEDVSC